MNINELTDPSHTTIIEKIADLLHLVSSETELAYHPVTGNVIFIDVLGTDFDEEDDDEEELTDGYLFLPTQYEIHEYAMMEEFALDYPDKKSGMILLNSLRGQGAFRRFKDMLIILEIRDEWFQFQNQKYFEIAEKWCKDNHLKQ